MKRELDACTLIERSIIKEFRKKLWKPFIVAVKRYELIKEGDRIAVCISGGKDSMLMAKLMQELQRHSPVHFELKFLVMDPGYSPENRAAIEENARKLNIPISVFETDVFEVANAAERHPCYLCARMRRGCLYSRAQAAGCNKIALGHHFNDVIETTVMGMFYGAQLQAMLPKLHSKNFPGMEVIRPMYCIHEDDIIAWAEQNDLHFIRCACLFTASNETCDTTSTRKDVKLLLRQLKQTTPDLEMNIFNAIHAASLDTMVGYKWKGQEHSFLEWYDGEKEPEILAACQSREEA